MSVATLIDFFFLKRRLDKRHQVFL